MGVSADQPVSDVDGEAPVVPQHVLLKEVIGDAAMSSGATWSMG